jgi:hypothetical protein
MRSIRLPWGTKALARRRAAAARARQEQERREAFARIAGLANTIREWDTTTRLPDR